MHLGASAARLLPVLRPALLRGNKCLASLVYRTYRKKGEAALDDFWIPTFHRYGQIRAAHIAQVMDIDPNNAASIGRYHDYQATLFGTQGHWEKTPEGEPVRVERVCDICDHLKKLSNGQGLPVFCLRITNAMNMGTGTALNPDYQVELESLLSEGDDACRFVHRIKPGSQNQGGLKSLSKQYRVVARESLDSTRIPIQVRTDS